ncbi:Gfo/Idh/MocA family protein [Campylobacter sp. 2014D-0216]|uniref:Gfo/Idh/MocA family protein n=1 Tax=Campylobacter sp. 2014D-0216 TaxID=1813595 RepID=UPI0018A36546|nr:Gfo/Idh/MocA family oxidoreductase [Campylobacter sp. 2014D-0216]QOR00881.1 Gfo/Idh/MocA family oxidoreductase [Campylobacter sp. 2014D-0216]
MKALIIGYGSIGRKHHLALECLGFKVSIVSKSYDKNKIECFKELYEANLETFDLFVIANITVDHYRTLKAIDSKVENKTILVEKPLFETFKTCHLSGKNDIFVAYLLRFHPLILDLKKIISQEPHIYFAELNCSSYLPNWRDCDYRFNYSAKKELGGGVLLDLSHEIDLAFFMFDKPQLLYAQNLKISELEINSDDFAFMSLKSKDSLIHIKLDYFSKLTKREIILHSHTKTYHADLINNKLHIYDKNALLETKEYQSDTNKVLTNLHKKVLKRDNSVCKFNEALEVLRLSDEVKRRVNG